MKKKKKGFTLVELLVVIAIIAILAAIITPNAFKAIEKSKVASAESDYKAIKTAALSYYSDAGEWPATGTNAKDPGFITKIGTVNAWNGPYLEKWPTKNPWGGTYTFNNGTKDTIITADNVKYITLTNVPTSATDRLEADLDGDSTDASKTGVVRYNTADKTVYLIISEQ